MPVWAQDILAWFIVLGLGGGYAVGLYVTILKCRAPGCWHQYGVHIVHDKQYKILSVCDEHYRDQSWLA